MLPNKNSYLRHEKIEPLKIFSIVLCSTIISCYPDGNMAMATISNLYGDKQQNYVIDNNAK